MVIIDSVKINKSPYKKDTNVSLKGSNKGINCSSYPSFYGNDAISKQLSLNFKGCVKFKNVSFGSKASQEEINQLRERLSNEKTKNGEPRFRYYNIIQDIIKFYTPEKKNVLDLLLNAKTLIGDDFRFSDEDLELTFRFYTPEKEALLKDILALKTSDGKEYLTNAHVQPDSCSFSYPFIRNLCIRELLDDPEREEKFRILLSERSKFNDSQFSFLLDFLFDVDKTVFEKTIKGENIDSLTSSEINSYLISLLSLKGYYNHINDNLQDLEKSEINLPLIPKLSEKQNFINRLMYCSKQMSSVKSKPLSSEQIKIFNNALEALDQDLVQFDFNKVIKPGKGLVLKFSREDFINEINNILSSLTSDQKDKIFKHYNFSLEKLKDKLVLRKYPSINDDNEIPDIDPHIKAKIDASIQKFTVDNKVILPEEYKNLENDLNAIISVLPEFITTVGKKQHETHKYTLDIHILKTLQEFIKENNLNKDKKASSITLFEKLKQKLIKNKKTNAPIDNDNKIAKIAILLHDIEKEEKTVDKEHPLKSALEVQSIIKKLNLTNRDQERIWGLVNYHHWLEALNTNKTTPQDIAFQFRKAGDFDIAKLFAKADLKAVNDNFYDSYKDSLEKYTQEVQNLVNQIHSTGIYVPQTRIPRASELKLTPLTLGKEGKETSNKVIKLKELKEPESLGFDKNTTPENFYAIIHAAARNFDSTCFAFDYSCKEGNNGVFSTSFISKDNCRTYDDRKFGFILDVDPENICVANSENLGSGLFKSVDNFKKYLFSPKASVFNNDRSYFSKKLKEVQKINSDEKYINLYKELVQKKAITDINDSELSKRIKETINAYILNPKSHNELVVYAPKPIGVFAKTDNPNEIPYELRKYAQDNDLPVVILD